MNIGVRLPSLLRHSRGRGVIPFTDIDGVTTSLEVVIRMIDTPYDVYVVSGDPNMAYIQSFCTSLYVSIHLSTMPELIFRHRSNGCT